MYFVKVIDYSLHKKEHFCIVLGGGAGGGGGIMTLW